MFDWLNWTGGGCWEPQISSRPPVFMHPSSKSALYSSTKVASRVRVGLNERRTAMATEIAISITHVEETQNDLRDADAASVWKHI